MPYIFICLKVFGQKLQRSIVLVLLSLPTLGYAIDDIPEQSGWSGYVVLGAGYSDFKSNVVAANALVDFDRETINSVFDSPRSDDTFHPAIDFEVAYTFGDQWQAFLGTSLEDQLTLDLAEQLGIRKQTPRAGIFQLGILSSGIPTDVWEDPYLAGVARSDTDRDSTGARFEWDKIFGTAFEFTLSVRDIDIDTERSGTDPALGLSPAEQALLERDGDLLAVSLSYLFKPAERHLIRPLIRYRENDRDGDAVSNDGTGFQLTYSYLGDDYQVVTNAGFFSKDYDAANPIYGIKQDSDTVVVDASLFYNLPTRSGLWQAVGTITKGEEDSDIAFHDNEIFQITLGVLYRFGGQ